jgi:Family of unknown function (DUF6719)
MKSVHVALITAGLLSTGAAPPAQGASPPSVTIQREPPEGYMRLGQRVRVDDGTCPPGQVKLVTAAQLTPDGIARTRVCVKR